MTDFSDKIQEYLGKLVTFVDDKAGKTTTGIMAHGNDDNVIGLKAEHTWGLKAAMFVNELQNVSDSHERVATHGALFYGPYFS